MEKNWPFNHVLWILSIIFCLLLFGIREIRGFLRQWTIEEKSIQLCCVTGSTFRFLFPRSLLSNLRPSLFYFDLFEIVFHSWLHCAVGKLPASQANAEVVSAFRREEGERKMKLLQNYLRVCSRAKVCLVSLCLAFSIITIINLSSLYAAKFW